MSLRIAPAQPVVHERGVPAPAHGGEGVAAVRGVGDVRDPVLARRHDLRISIERRAQQHDPVGTVFAVFALTRLSILPARVVSGLRALQVGDPAPVRTP